MYSGSAAERVCGPCHRPGFTELINTVSESLTPSKQGNGRLRPLYHRRGAQLQGRKDGDIPSKQNDLNIKELRQALGEKDEAHEYLCKSDPFKIVLRK